MGTGAGSNYRRVAANMVKGAHGEDRSAGRGYICGALDRAGGCSRSGLKQFHHFHMLKPASQ